MNQLKCKEPIFLILIFFLIASLLGGCINEQQPKPKAPAKTEQPKKPAAIGEKWKLPISIQEGEFDKLSGWLSDNQVLYITNLEQTSNVYCYDLISGKSELIYKSNFPIVNVQVSPSKKYALIHSAPSSYEGLVTIIDTKGAEQAKKTFTSYELVFEWNPYNEDEILVSKFNEDWTFQLALLNIKNSKTLDLSLPQPFNKWIDKKNVAFLNWDENNPALFAPLIVKDLENGIEKTLFPSLIQFSAFPDLLMTISVKEQDQSLATYSFFDNKIKQLFTFSIPQLTKFSDWLVPFYDYNEHTGQFITLSPLNSGEADSYTDGFQLLTYDIRKGSKRLILEGLENAPITLSPSGSAALFGNRFENIIDIDAKKIYKLIKE